MLNYLTKGYQAGALGLLALWLGAAAAAAAQGPAAAKLVEPVHTGWRFREEGKADWHPAAVPGCVHTDLLANKLIDDPFYRDNEAKLQWIGKTTWEYETAFDPSAAVRGHQHVDLVFEGLDTYAEVRLNDKPILQADNMFRTWRVDVKSALRPGPNRLHIRFRSALAEVAALAAGLPQQRPAPNDEKGLSSIGETGAALSMYARKAPHQYGWDWGPRFISCGVWKPLTLEAWDAARVSDLLLRTDELKPDRARLTAVVTVEVAQAGTYALQVAQVAAAPEKSTAQPVTLPVTLRAGRNEVPVPITVAQPQLWYPNGYGAHPLYTFRATLLQDQKPLDAAQRRTGLRTVVLRQDVDKWGKSFEFVVNGIPIFAKGANWIPCDAFPTRVPRQRYHDLLATARDVHMNMVRAWGGGIYEADEFYDECDEMGLLVWQEFMFACSAYPATDAFLASVRAEATDQVRRLRNHPAIAVWCGNNEGEWAWGEWGWRDTYPLTWWLEYRKLFTGTLAEVVAAEDPSRAYRSSSPSADFLWPVQSPQAGDVHYWGVWHGGEPMSNYEKQFPRFMSEYGFQAYPELATVSTFARPADYDMQSAVMRGHQKNQRGNAIIKEYLDRDYGAPKDFAALLYLSQVQQAEGVRIAAEHLRRIRPRNMGTLYWQLDDCWPVASWSSVDYYGRWKALHYYARRFYDDLLVSPHEEKDSLRVYLVSDRTTPTPAQLVVRLTDFRGKVLFEKTQAVTVAPLASQVHFGLPIGQVLQGHDRRDAVLTCRLEGVAGAAIAPARRYFAPVKGMPLPKATVKTSWATGPAGTYRLRLSTNALARDISLAYPAGRTTFSDNFFDLLPGETKEVEVRNPDRLPLAKLRQSLVLRSLADSF